MAKQSVGQSLARRGVLAGAAALVAGALAKASERVAQAAGNGAALTMGNNDDATNAPTSGTRLVRGGVSGSGAYALQVVDDRSPAINRAVRGDAGPTAGFLANFVAANDSLNFGVNGTVSDPNGPGVMGQRGNASLQNTRHYGVAGYAQNDTDGIGVYGEGAAYGVLGTANTAAPAQGQGAGVLGQSNTGVGVQGSSNGNVGVLGTSGVSHGLYGASTNGYGLYATSSNSTGIVASTNGGNAIQGASNGNVGVLGTSNSSIGGYFASGTATGLYATGPAAGFAARFDGPVLVNGNFTAIGGSKSAAVPHPDGSHRRLYCVESPESWFEDFGKDRLANGRAQVRLDRDFAVLVHGEVYQVFLTPEGDCNGLYVSSKSPQSFEVREMRGGSGTLTFGYRVVAKRKDIPGPRLERVELPGVPQRPTAPPPPPAIPAVPPPSDSSTPPRRWPSDDRR